MQTRLTNFTQKGKCRDTRTFQSSKVRGCNIENFIHDTTVQIGENFHFSFELTAKESIGNIRLEYLIGYLKSNNRHTKKVFMLTQGKLEIKSKTFTKKQSFKDMTTRKHYAGEHFISILINGEEKARGVFLVD